MPSSSTPLLRPLNFLVIALFCFISTQNIQAAEPAGDDTTTAGNMMEQCKEMQARRDQMMADMKAQDTALAEQVAQMNSAADDRKLDLLAALVTRMAEQRIAKNAQMATMSDKMMNHMMQHMERGKESMQGCPMMKAMGRNDRRDMGDMKGMDDSSADPAEGQQP